jgi:hypothetical protein
MTTFWCGFVIGILTVIVISAIIIGSAFLFSINKIEDMENDYYHDQIQKKERNLEKNK